MTNTDSRPYNRRKGEPNLWYDRFHKFMKMGPGRSLTRCYRETINAGRARQGRPLLPSSVGCPESWRQRYRQFDWEVRAEAWDEEQRRQDLLVLRAIFSQARKLLPEAIQVLADTMRGELKNPDGTLTEGQNCSQRRMAAEKIIELGNRSDEYLQEDSFEGPIRIREIVIHHTEDKDESQEQSDEKPS